MTCEVAVMNTRGIALAADSAVTLGDGEKIYHNAEKLLQLVPNAPVGFMTFGAADLAGVPWETIVAGYQKHLGDKRYDTLREYLDDIVAFIERESIMFPEAIQEQKFAEVAARLWRGLYARRWDDELAATRASKSTDRLDLLRRIIAEDHPRWERYPRLERDNAALIDQVLHDYASALDDVERETFDGIKLPKDIRNGLRTTLRHLLSSASFLGSDFSGVVIAGMGEAEPFPNALVCKFGPMVKGQLRFHLFDHARITHTDTAMVIPFAQRETIDMIIEGIHPDLAEAIPSLLSASLKHNGGAKKSEAKCDAVFDHFHKGLKKEIRQKYSGPFIDAVNALPRQDLAAMAESLVNLTAFRAHASAGVRETVAGPVDVAVLSKGDGFVWVKRKKFGII
jgi:hypothetical protein